MRRRAIVYIIEHFGCRCAVGRGGNTFTRRVTYAKGCPEHPLAAADVEAKFRWLAGSVVDDGQVEAIMEAVYSIKSAGSVDQLIALLQFEQA
jgi:hypothetical protein